MQWTQQLPWRLAWHTLALSEFGLQLYLSVAENYLPSFFDSYSALYILL